ncbi:MAG TPA: DUF2779 domain-containing protein [Saprospiraceae bacterium]|nr:DUF2779 domain-containing protein [Saprospiraceae bacterium]
MHNLISKSDFKKYLQCPEYFWFYKNRPAVLAEKQMSDFEKNLSEQGKLVEQKFYERFPKVHVLTSKNLDAVTATKEFDNTGDFYLGQAAFIADGFFAQSDLVHFKGDKTISIYEIKSSSSGQVLDSDDSAQAASKEEHLIDLCFQYLVASTAGYRVERLFLVELNKTYIKTGELNLSEFFNISDVSSKIQTMNEAIIRQMTLAASKSMESVQPVTCDCKYKARKNQCVAFPYLHPDMMGYTIHDLSRIGNSKKRLIGFIDNDITRLEDIPADWDLTDPQKDQVLSWNQNQEIIHKEEIISSFKQLKYPLYFLDYETLSSAIPIYDGTKPYQQIPFQYSLHIINEPGSMFEHREFLHLEQTNPMESLSQHLRADIGDEGSVVVWNKKFEGMCNKGLAETVPELSKFLLGINKRFFDLMDIFSKRMYVHKDFKGSSSIKKVLPVLVPHLSYKDLTIGDGGTATTAWKRMVFEINDANEKEKIKMDLLAYCKLDTLAMVEIFRKIIEKTKTI